MKPAFSVVCFTVLSGAGLGLLALAGLVVLFDLPWLMPDTLPWAVGAGWLLTVAGLSSSTLHLAAPRNAWRAVSRFRTSWLSREAVFALLLVGVAALLLIALATGAGRAVVATLAVLTVLLAWIVLVCTAMIYASLKPIRQWHTRLVPIAYVVLGHWSGALILLGFARVDGAYSTRIAHLCLVLALASVLVKGLYWRRNRGGAGSLTLEQAIGVERGVRPPAGTGPSVMRARLFDAGHTGRTFLTDEFGHRLRPGRRGLLLAAFWVLGLGVPLAWIVAASWSLPVVVGACASALAGLLAERWLFFADARHTVRLFHGDART